jgi:hypothetical protein
MDLPIYRSEYNPLAPEEGALDPLGLAATAEQIALYTSPGLLDRQKRIRFLTFIAIGILLKEECESEYDGRDAKCSFWEAYEWLIVSALISNPPPSGLTGLPGSEKAQTAKKKNLPLNRERYLSISTVFGFYGVYKFLATQVQIQTQSVPGENAKTLAHAWATDQNLQNFIEGSQGNGALLKKRIIKTLIQTLKEGVLTEKWNSRLLQDIAPYFDLNRIGVTERAILTRLIVEDPQEHRRQLVGLMKKKGYPDHELEFFQSIQGQCSRSLEDGIHAALEYENLSFLLNQSFDLIRIYLTRHPAGASAQELARVPDVVKFSKHLKRALEGSIEAISKIPDRNWQHRVQPLSWALETQDTNDFVIALIEHHFENQKRKPPNGKLPWLYRTELGNYCVRPGYLLEELKNEDPHFSHSFRTLPLHNFARELGVL